MEIERIPERNHREINSFIKKHWFSTEMVVRGQMIDMAALDGFVMYDNSAIVGLITYRITGQECEIMSLNSIKESKGIGTALIHEAVRYAKEQKCKIIKLITTNDNINAIRFYQKFGFDMAYFYRNAMEEARTLKPSIPIIGENGIPLRHEIEFEMDISTN